MMKRICYICGLLVLVLVFIFVGGQFLTSANNDALQKGDTVVIPEATKNVKTDAIQNETDMPQKEEKPPESINLSALHCDNESIFVSVCEDNGWIYYSNPADQNRIYKAKPDGTEKKLLCSDIADYIAVDGDWIFYTNGLEDFNLYKIKTDGTQRIALTTTDTCACPNIVDDYIYYNNAKDNGYMYKIKKDGTSRKKVTDRGSYWLKSDGKYIYYMRKGYTPEQMNELEKRALNKELNTDEPFFKYDNLYRLNTENDKSDKILNECAINLSISGDWIYFENVSNSRALYKVRKDGSGKTKLTDTRASDIIVVGDWILFSDERKRRQNICRIKTDGTNESVIFDGPITLNFKVSEDWVYYKTDSVLYRMKIDGSSNQRF